MTSPDDPGSPPPPSLFAAATSPRGQPDELRMLSGLDPRPGASAEPRKRTGPIAALVGGLLVIGAVAGWQLNRSPAPAESVASTPLSSAPALPAAPEMPASAAPQTTAAAPGGDTRVDPLMALVGQLERDTRPAAPPPSGKAAARKPALQAATLDKLVRSCKQFGGAEEAHCRRQICAGNWGRAAACPARVAASRESVEKR